MDDVYIEIYFVLLSAFTLAIGGLLVACLFYVLSIIHDIKKISRIARKESEIISKGLAKGVGILGSELSNQTIGFVRTVFSILLTQFAGPKNKRKKSNLTQ